MRNLVFLSLIALLIWSCSGGGKKEIIQSRSEQDLLASFLDYHKKKDLPGILGLFYQKDTPQFVLDSVKNRSQKNFSHTITAAQIEEIPPDKLAKFMAGMPFDDKTLIPNLTPVKQITFKFAQTGESDELRATGGTIMFGKVDNVCYFILSKLKEAGSVATTPATKAPTK